MLENEHKILRFVAKMVRSFHHSRDIGLRAYTLQQDTKHKEDRDRRFVISYRLADDMMTIYEPPQR